MKAVPTVIPEVKIIEPKVFGDDRGFFFESFNRRRFAELIGRDTDFVQDNHSRSVQGVLLDVAVDIRRSSPTFGQHVTIELSAENNRMFWMPEGFAHGFLVISDMAECLYKTTDYWHPEHERCIRWNDPHLAIDWGGQDKPALSEKDAQGKAFTEAELFL